MGHGQSPRASLRKRDRREHCVAVLFSGHRETAPRRCNGVAIHLPNLHRPRRPVFARRIPAQKDCSCGVEGWVGITFVVQPDWLTGDVQALPLIPALIGILGALFTALAYVSVRRLSATEHPLVIILYFPLISVPITLPWVIGTGVWPMGMEWIWLLGIGVFTQLGQIWVTDGLRRLPAARATSINYIQVVFAASWGWLWFSESISLWQIGGGGLVLIATMISLSAKNNQPT